MILYIVPTELGMSQTTPIAEAHNEPTPTNATMKDGW